MRDLVQARTVYATLTKSQRVLLNFQEQPTWPCVHCPEMSAELTDAATAGFEGRVHRQDTQLSQWLRLLLPHCQSSLGNPTQNTRELLRETVLFFSLAKVSFTTFTKCSDQSQTQTLTPVLVLVEHIWLKPGTLDSTPAVIGATLGNRKSNKNTACCMNS